MWKEEKELRVELDDNRYFYVRNRVEALHHRSDQGAPPREGEDRYTPGRATIGTSGEPLFTYTGRGGDDGLAPLLYTSGTTGATKRTMTSPNNKLATITGLLAAWGWGKGDVLMTPRRRHD
jgi:long-subunit acyl-CoA synthetase (AMP-forming)